MNDAPLNWEELYQKADTGWDRGNPSPALKQWLDDGVLAPGSRILIPGCGRGHEVITLAKRGYAVTGLDIAASAIDALQQGLDKALTHGHGICADLFDYEPVERFDIIYEQTCLCTLSMQQRIDYEQCLYRWLNADGVLLLLLMQTGDQGGPPFHCDLMDMRQLFDDSRWLWPDHAPLLIPRPKGPRFELGFILRRKMD